MTLQILYLVHDVSDPAVSRRIAMLKEGGASVTLAGFRRTPQALPNVTDFGQTFNGGFAQRILAVLQTVGSLHRHRALFAGADVILARNLEMLAIGVRGRSLCPRPPALIYESLDIHRLLLKPGPLGCSLRTLEGWMGRRAKALITSSPAFVREYFQNRSKLNLPILLVENKLY
ncbi:MAG: glycosyl transferase family 1, partial [Rickettsiales bacterium]|nr:glycosyl transferase family 1 [Rickettsiales bacterium]